LDAEVSWNKGISVDQKFKLFTRDAMFSLDFYRNDFTNQVITDIENVREVNFYNLKGKSYSNSFQAEISLEPIKKLDIRIAYRYLMLKQPSMVSYYNGLLLLPTVHLLTLHMLLMDGNLITPLITMVKKEFRAQLAILTVSKGGVFTGLFFDGCTNNQVIGQNKPGRFLYWC
jgi:hypothetical protein